MSWLDRLRGRRDVERSAAGEPMYRHTRARKARYSAGDPDLIEAISDYVSAHIGEPEGVYHQIISEYVHVDIHLVPPSEERPWVTLVTSGMSERAMKAPRHLGAEVERAELMMVLPPDWPLDHEDFEDERHYWPFRLLQQLAALPHQFDTWLWIGHTIPNGEPAEPYAPNTELCCAILFPPVLFGSDFGRMEANGRTVTFLGVYPLYAEEMQLKLDAGADELAERFDAADVTEALEIDRPNVARDPDGD